jgi:hypothetical protein
MSVTKGVCGVKDACRHDFLFFSSSFFFLNLKYVCECNYNFISVNKLFTAFRFSFRLPFAAAVVKKNARKKTKLFVLSLLFRIESTCP